MSIYEKVDNNYVLKDKLQDLDNNLSSTTYPARLAFVTDFFGSHANVALFKPLYLGESFYSSWNKDIRKVTPFSADYQVFSSEFTTPNYVIT